MRTANCKRLALIVIWQALMVAALFYSDLNATSRRWIPSIFGLAALPLPFVFYIAALYDAPLFARWHRILKASVLTLSSVIVTVGGYSIMFYTGLLIEEKLSGNQQPSTVRDIEPGAALKAQLVYNNRLLAALDKVGQQKSGDQAAIAQVGGEFLRREQSLLSNYYVTAKPLVQKRLLDTADIESTNGLEKRRTLLLQFIDANRAMTDYVDKAENEFRTMLLKKGLPEGTVEEETRRLHVNMGKLNQTSAIFSINDRIAQTELRALGLLESNWSSWSYDSSLGKTVFTNEKVRTEFNRMVFEIHTADKERTGLQQQLQQNVQRNPMQ
jgi:hypothetical protein